MIDPTTPQGIAFCRTTEEYLTRLAVEVRATEAAAFFVNDGNLDTITHVRAGTYTPDLAQRAIDNFKAIAQGAVDRKECQAREIVAPGQGTHLQFCLVLPLPAADGSIVSVFTFIVRAESREAANKMLGALRVPAPRV
ncbi:MAG TPA: hypothetical protein VGN72_16715 [Tepidisphaeraceae bacterium]|jgi:hypothetical protein|nr:hypothetical protein [Tepidisphaeraceae bacterium]